MTTCFHCSSHLVSQRTIRGDHGRRLVLVKEVEALENKLSKSPLTANTKRAKITSFIAEKQSRQEFSPRVGKAINKAHIEPLHLKNNACAYMFKLVLLFSIEKSKVSNTVTEFSKMGNQSPFARLIHNLKTQSNLSCLAKKKT